jgi:hypothetical protein
MGTKRDRIFKNIPSFESQIALHEAAKLALDLQQAMAEFHAMMIETARWDATRGVDPMERWRRGKEAEEGPDRFA